MPVGSSHAESQCSIVDAKYARRRGSAGGERVELQLGRHNEMGRD
jgi:hypothetical protein